MPTHPSDESLAEHEQLLLRQSIRLLSQGAEPGVAVREMLHLLSELVGLNRGRVVLPDPDTGLLCIRHAYGLTRDEVARGRYRLGEGITGQVMQTGETLIVQDIDHEPRYLARAVARSTLPEGTVSYIALPIRVEQRVMGVLGVHRIRSRRRALGDDLQLLRTLAELMGQVFRIHQLIEERTASLAAENRELRAALQEQATPATAWGIVGEAPALMTALRQLEQVAHSDATVMLLGESGTGKELFARALHLHSRRRDQPFVKVNCAAIPESLFEAELFGHEKGAFTGATTQRIGRFEQAHGGTLFLDEIGDLPPAVQVKLLRVLQERVIERLGSHQERPVDVRVVAATHRDLMALVQAGRFRLDLFYRLNVIPIRLPALRERRGDIKLLLQHFLSQLNQRHQRNVLLTPQALSRLVAHPWPGNIRQLFNVVERLVLLSHEDRIDLATADWVLRDEATHAPADEPPTVAGGAPLRLGRGPRAPSVVRPYEHVRADERDTLRQALQAHAGNKSRTAQALGLTLRQLNYRLQLLGLDGKAASPRRTDKV
ncbi:GAF domain-containing protein [Aquabacterium fontiphilum]|jgi:Nif-specific regulatory protein|uniref:sigma-54 interaction domain-containing protein n=1 Tax=Aquabacterium fontiphilum TaxID=450365 RepID=UPI001377D48F|nr:sigma 54-interacting transcriptional regulator [Aquabacterium fontiphilum]NBD21431.1 GAF domain-containing protein [Aquabacterium fontiphilum]